MGKSTLMKLVQKHFPEYYCTDGFSRPLREASIKLGLTSLQEQILIGELTAWAWTSNLTRKKYLSTRSIIDPIVYSAVLGYESESKRLEKIWQDNLDIAKEARYFYIPIEFPVEDDGVRFTDEKFRKEVDIQLINFLNKYDIRYFVLNGPVEQRFDRISFLLKA